MIFDPSVSRRLARARAARRRGGRQRGAVAVEAAILTPLLLLLLFGIIEFGLLFKDWLAVTSSVRAGTRIASAEPRVDNYALDAAKAVAKEGSALDMTNVTALWVYKADPATGYPIGGDKNFNSCTQCVKFAWNKTTKAFVQSSSSWPASQQNACVGGPPDTIGVLLKIQHPSVTGLIFNNMTITEHSVMSLEPAPTSAPTGCKPAP